MKEKRNWKAAIWKALPYLWLLGGFLLMLLYHMGPGRSLVDGDMGGEMILSDLLNQEGDFLLSKNWYYATEIHVFFMQIIFRPLLLIFPDNWHMVRVVGTALIYIINSLGCFFMLRQMGVKNHGIWCIAALLWPVGMWRLFLGLYGGQYLVYDFFTCYILGLILFLSKKNWKGISGKAMAGQVACAFMLGFLSLAGGVNGIRETMMLFAPVCAGIFFILAVHTYEKHPVSLKEWITVCNKELKLTGWILYGLFFNVAGYAYNLLVLMKKYEYQSNTTMKLTENFSLNHWISSVSDFFGLFGYGGNVRLLSVKGISSACGIAIALLLLFVTIRLFFLRKKMTLGQEFLFASYIGGLVVCGLAFGHMTDMNEPRFWLPFMIFGFVAFQIAADVEEFSLPHMREIAGIAVAVLIIGASVGTMKTQIDTPHQGRAKNQNLADFLVENGYTQGYAEFWTANSVTELTSGKVHVRPLMYNETFEMITWSNRIDYATSLPEGEVFYAIYKRSFGDINECCFYKYGNGEVVLDDEDWFVLSFDDAGQMQKAYEIALENGEVADQATRIGQNG